MKTSVDASALVESLLEAEDPKTLLRSYRLPPKQLLTVGEEISHGTAITRDIMRRCLHRLARLDPKRYQKEMKSRDLRDFLLTGDEDAAPFDPEYYLDRLYGLMEEYCPPFTTFGSSEGDGTSIGCWPMDSMTLQDVEDWGELTRIRYPRAAAQENWYQDWQDQVVAIRQGNFERVPTEYVMIEHKDGTLELWHKPTKKRVWKY